jgi:Tfp pilus assembly protein PilO
MFSAERADTLGRVVGALLLLAFVALASQHILRPWLTARRNLSAYRQAVEILSAGEVDLVKLREEIRTSSQALASAEARLPAEPNLDDYLGILGQVGKETRVQIERLSPQATEDFDLYRKLAIEARVTGSFMSVYRFLARLEGGEQLTRIERLQVARRPSQEFCAADIRLALYFAPKEGS